jgi:hypothetical protein
MTGLAVDFAKDVVGVPLVARLRSPLPHLIGVSLAKLPAPLANSLISHMDPVSSKKFFDIAIAEGETEIDPAGATISVG